MGGFFGSLGCHLSTCCLKPVCQGKPKWSQQIKFTGFGKKGLVWELYPTNITWKKKKKKWGLKTFQTTMQHMLKIKSLQLYAICQKWNNQFQGITIIFKRETKWKCCCRSQDSECLHTPIFLLACLLNFLQLARIYLFIFSFKKLTLYNHLWAAFMIET